MRLFAKLSKVNLAKREVTGILSQETLDYDGEVMDYESSKPFFMAWSRLVEEDSGGKSLGNLRAMHRPEVVGKLTDISFDDDNKAIRITGKVVDDAAWKMVQEGGYTGFSVGGKYVDSWEHLTASGQKASKFTADPIEASLVDRPSVPTALFESIKGVMIDVDDTNHIEAASFDEFVDIIKRAAAGDDERDDLVEKAKKKEGEYGDVAYADAKNKKYPIDTADHIRAAWTYINMPKNQKEYSAQEVAEIKAKIIAAWKRKIDPKGPPSARQKKAADIEMSKAMEHDLTKLAAQRAALEKALVKQAQMKKGLYAASALADVLATLRSFCEQQAWEDFQEGTDVTTVVNQIKSLLPTLAGALVQYVGEEARELLSGVAVDFNP